MEQPLVTVKEDFMKKLGLIVNPIAGMGGKVGLKGTDGKDILKRARELGSEPEAPEKAVRALKQLKSLGNDLKVLVAKGPMGEMEAKEAELNYEIVYTPEETETSTSDTTQVAKLFEEKEVDLILFVGGDGTARDVQEAVEQRVPALGVPAGVKIYSAVQGNTPESAGTLAKDYLQESGISLKEMEVIDLDEEGFRNDEVNIQVFGYLNVPYDESHLQSMKSPSPQSDEEAQESIALHVIDHLEEDVFYIIGSGSTPSQILKELDQPVTILGVDIMKNKETVAKDVSEQTLLDTIGDDPVKLIVTPMGGQGYILGRGNQQISDKVLKKISKDDIIILSTPGKLRGLGKNDMQIYTMDPKVNQSLEGYYKVITGYGQENIKKASTQQNKD